MRTKIENYSNNNRNNSSVAFISVRTVKSVARVFGVETHWIAGALLINKEIKEVLKIPEEYDVGFFGIAGFPSEEIMQEFLQLHEICFAESWKKSFR